MLYDFDLVVFSSHIISVQPLRIKGSSITKYSSVKI